MRKLYRFGAVLFVLLAGLGGATQGQAYTIYSQTGRVIHISDGDTFTVDLDGGDEIRIRITGLNTMETGQCHAQAAEDRLRELIDGKRVTLTARKLGSMSGERYWRWVSVNGTDVGTVLLNEGLAVPFPHFYEDAKNYTYMRVGTVAARKKIGIWDDNACGNGPDQDNLLRLWVQWDADGTDNKNLNGEYVRIKNYGDDAVSLAGWWLRDSVDHYYYFKSTQSIPANGRVTIHMGKGTNTSTNFYANFGRTIFGNPAPDNSRYGDGAYLLDRNGDIRAYMMYPCVYACSANLKGKIRISVRANPDGSPDDPNDEYVKITNVSGGAINLAGYLLESPPYIYDFDHRRGLSSKLKPDQSMRIYIGKGHESDRLRHWGKSEPILTNPGDLVIVRTFDRIRAACKDWGSASC